MLFNIIMGTIAILATTGLCVAPVMWYKERTLRLAFQAVLGKFSIVYCSACGKYEVGKHSMCFKCIQSIAKQNQLTSGDTPIVLSGGRSNTEVIQK